MSDVTQILSAIEHGDAHAAEQLLPLVYDELRRLAAQKMMQEKPDQTLQAGPSESWGPAYPKSLRVNAVMRGDGNVR